MDTCPPRKRIYADNFAEGGDELAMKSVIRRLWIQYLELNGLPDDACPYSDLI